MKADAVENSLIFVFIHTLNKASPINHILVLLTFIAPINAKPHSLWLEMPINKTGFRGRVKRRKEWTTANPTKQKIYSGKSPLWSPFFGSRNVGE